MLADIRDRPDLREEAGPVGVNGQSELARARTGPAIHAIAVPFDPAVPATNDGEPFGVDLDPEPVRRGQRRELLRGAEMFRCRSPTSSSDHRVAPDARASRSRHCATLRPRQFIFTREACGLPDCHPAGLGPDRRRASAGDRRASSLSLPNAAGVERLHTTHALPVGSEGRANAVRRRRRSLCGLIL